MRTKLDIYDFIRIFFSLLIHFVQIKYTKDNNLNFVNVVCQWWR